MTTTTTRACGAGLVLLLVFGKLTSGESLGVWPSSLCPLHSIEDAVVGFRDPICPFDSIESFQIAGVVEGGETSLQRALSMVHRRSHDYVAVFFYASWCPFSQSFRPYLSLLSSLYPSIPHFAIEESVVRPSVLSKYGVHGFPTLFLLNSTMRTRYHGSRTLGSLINFYANFTGVKIASVDTTSMYRIGQTIKPEKSKSLEQETCPFSWARSPEKLLPQETYLALATVFVILRFLYLSLPCLLAFAHFAWRRRVLNIRLRSLWDVFSAFLNRSMQLFSSLKEPCKRSNLSAKAWASKSLASVSLAEGSTNQ